MKIREAAQKGITRVRLPIWADDCYLRIHLVNTGSGTGYGAFLNLYHRSVQEIIGAETPQTIMFTLVGDADYEEYTGSVDRDDK